ncbi:unnamed protein product [Heterobilharzia americana]|nr:unnamed protein product [Heterobilharzia americana]
MSNFYITYLFILKLIHIKSFSIEHLIKSNLFCTDLMFETGLTFELFNNSTLPLFGKEKWYSIENLITSKKLENLKVIHFHDCFNKTIRKYDNCWNMIRQQFIEYSIPIEYNNVREIIDKYEKRQITEITNYNVYLKYLNALCFTACYSRYKANLKSITDYQILCPFPCIIQKDCSFDECKDLGVFKHEYECLCSNSDKWDSETLECLPNNLYEIRQSKEIPDFLTKEKHLRSRVPRNCEKNSNCDKNGTLFCTLDSNHQYTECVCKPHYHGYYCQEKIDACAFRIEHHLQPNGGTLIAGSRACNVNNPGNKCIPLTSIDGHATYRCQCNESGWMPDIKLPYPNCMRRLTKCDSLIYVNGFCVSNNLGDQAVIICDPGYMGISCNEWVGEWSEWSVWDKCRPACGNLRYSLRVRECLSMKLGNKSKQCLGSAVEYVRCSEHLCNYLGISYFDIYLASRQNMVSVSLACGAVLCALLVLIWILTCYGSVASVYKIIINHAWKEEERSRNGRSCHGNLVDCIQ